MLVLYSIILVYNSKKYIERTDNKYIIVATTNQND